MHSLIKKSSIKMNNFVCVYTFELDSKADRKKGNHHPHDGETWEEAVIVYFCLIACHTSHFGNKCVMMFYSVFFFVFFPSVEMILELSHIIINIKGILLSVKTQQIHVTCNCVFSA